VSSLLPWETAPQSYARLLTNKADRVENELRALGAPTAQRFASAPLAYRGRAEFRLWHTGDDSHYAMFDPREPRQPVRIDNFPASLPAIQAAMPALLDGLSGNQQLRHKLFQVEFMASRDGDLLLTLAYHRRLDDPWQASAGTLADALGASIIGRSRGQKRVIGRDYIVETFTVDGRAYRYRQYEQAFAQPNPGVNEQMLNWASAQAAALDGDLLELYCGNGNFTLPLAARFGAVVATELSKNGTRAALENLRDNRIDNVDVVRLSAEEVSAALAGEREFRRLSGLPQALADYDLRSVFVDPPRAGLDPATLRCVRRFDTILYVSCNPTTLRDNLAALGDSHRIAALALFDQFPYTAHMECAVRLERR
jgi:tRNA (uracil-5-)-methyltransferase